MSCIRLFRFFEHTAGDRAKLEGFRKSVPGEYVYGSVAVATDVTVTTVAGLGCTELLANAG